MDTQQQSPGTLQNPATTLVAQALPGIPETVLVVEDEMSTAEQTEVMLIEIGVVEVAIAATMEAAETMLQHSRFDLAILDYDRAEAINWSIAKRLCDAQVRIIVTTPLATLDLPPSCGDARILRKPYSLNDIAALIRS